MFRLAALFVALMGAACLPVGAANAQSAAEADADETEALLTEYHRSVASKSFGKALAAADRLKPDNPTGEAVVSMMKASALLGLKREREARALIEQADKLAPLEPQPSAALFLGALLAKRADVSAERLDLMIARFPDAVRELSPHAVNFVLRDQGQEKDRRSEDRVIGLASLGFGGDLPAGDYMAIRAIDILVERGAMAAATDLVRYVDEPRIVEDMLIQKRYSALWPLLEKRAGPHLETVRASSVKTAEQAYAQSPDDDERLSDLIYALSHANRHREAIALRSRLPATREAMATASEDMGWAVNNLALALHEAGRPDEADSVFALLTEAPVRENNWLVSMLINRLELLVTGGRFKKALPLIEPTAKAKGTPYAEQLVRRLRYCTMAGLGQREEAAKLLPDLLAHADDAYHATVDALLCGGLVDKAEEVALAALKSGKGEAFLRTLQANLLTADSPTAWHDRWKLLRGRPAIRTEFERLARDMPAQFLPPPIAR